VLLITPIFRPFRAGPFLDMLPGLKPQAESYSPFGTKAQGPVRKIDSTSALDFEHEDEHSLPDVAFVPSDSGSVQ
jgi:hypothetical protein